MESKSGPYRVPSFGDMRERYLTDPTTRRAIDLMHQMLDELHLDPFELRNCAVFAAHLHSERCLSPMLLVGSKVPA